MGTLEMSQIDNDGCNKTKQCGTDLEAVHGEDKLCRKYYQLFVALIANTGFISIGTAVGMSGLIPAQLKESSNDITMTLEEESWFASMFVVGTFIGGFGGGFQNQYLGRKKTMLTANLIVLCGFLITRFAYTVPMLYAGRFLIGYTNGLWTQSAPIYTGEVNQPRLRKFTGSLFMVSFTVGYALVYMIGAVCYWRDAVTVVSVWPAINFLLLFACPESPTWLMNKGRKTDAIRTVKLIRNNEHVSQIEIDRMERNMQAQQMQKREDKSASYVREQLNIMRRGTFIRPFLVLCFIHGITFQWTGVPALGFYFVDILKGLNVPMDAYWAAALLTLYRLFIVIMGAIVSSFVPRRQLYLCCNILAVSGTVILGTCGYLNTNDHFLQIQQEYPVITWLPMVGIVLFYTGVSGGLIPVAFVLLAELLPSNARGLGTTLVCTCSNISFFLSTKFVPHLKEALGLHGLFYMFTGVSCLSVIFSYFAIPETYGKSLESIEDHYRKVCYGDLNKIVVTDADTISPFIDTNDKILVNIIKDDKEVMNASEFPILSRPSTTRRQMSTDSYVLV